MAGNIDPIASKIGYVDTPGAQVRTAAAVVFDGTGTIGTDIYKIWTSDATNSGFLRSAIIKYSATAATASNACVLSFFLSSKTSGATTDADTIRVKEIAIPALTPSTTVALPDMEVVFGYPLSPGWTLLCKVSVTQPAACGFVVTGIGGKY